MACHAWRQGEADASLCHVVAPPLIDLTVDLVEEDWSAAAAPQVAPAAAVAPPRRAPKRARFLPPSNSFTFVDAARMIEANDRSQ